jgi:hypothetical protein
MWPFDKFVSPRYDGSTPITDELRAAAKLVGVTEDPKESGFLTQAKIIRALAEAQARRKGAE